MIKGQPKYILSCIQMFFTAFGLCSFRLFKLETERQTINVQDTSLQSYKTLIKILAYPGLA